MYIVKQGFYSLQSSDETMCDFFTSYGNNQVNVKITFPVPVPRGRTIPFLLLLARLRRRGEGRRRMHWVHLPDQRRRQQGDFIFLWLNYNWTVNAIVNISGWVQNKWTSFCHSLAQTHETIYKLQSCHRSQAETCCCTEVSLHFYAQQKL